MNDENPQQKGIEIIKSFFLSVLIVLAIFQTSELWFRNSNRNFFDVFFNFQDLALANQDVGAWGEYFVVPTRLLTTTGGNRFFVEYAPVPAGINSLWQVVISALSEDWQTVEPLDVRIFNQRSVLYTYNFYMPTFVFLEHFGISQSENTLDTVLPFFNHILFVPSTTASNIVYIYFVGLDQGNMPTMVSYTVTTNLHNVLVGHIQTMSINRNIDDLYYSSTEIIGFEFEQNMFLPHWRGPGLIYNPLVASPAMEGATVEDIAHRLSVFFSNPARVWSDYRDGAFVLGDYNSVVVLHNHRVEYTNHASIGTNQGFLRDFDIAKNFLNFVNTLDDNQGRFFLSWFESAYDTTTFYFDYVINGMRVYLDNSRDEHGHWASVSVSGGIVTNFNQILLDVQIESQAYSWPINLISFINTMVVLDQLDMDQKLGFGYVLDREEEPGRIFATWVVE